MNNIQIFKNLSEVDIKKFMTKSKTKILEAKKDRTIMTNMAKIDEFGIIIKGSANLIKYDINGNIVILNTLEENDVFGSIFSYNNEENSVITTSDSKILFINYSNLLDLCIKKENNYNNLINNIFYILNEKITSLNNRIDLLTKRSIRDKLLSYFEYECNKKASNSFNLPFSYTSLANFLAVDRSAMMREIKSLKEDGFVITNKKRITIVRY